MRAVARAAVPALVVAVLALPPAVAGAATGVVGTWGFDEAGGQHALDAGPFGLDGRLGRDRRVGRCGRPGPHRRRPVAAAPCASAARTFVRLPTWPAALAPPAR